jgi:hypothetical protein
LKREKPEKDVPASARERETRKVHSIAKRSTQILILLVLASLWFQSGSISLGLILGGAVAILNFCWLGWIMEKVFFERKRLHGMQMFIKFFVLAGVIFLILQFTRIHPMALIVGLSTLLLGTLIEGLKEALRSRSEAKKS